MPVPLHAPPPLTHQDGLPPFSAQRATLTHPPPNSASAAPHREQPAATTPAFFSSPPRPLSASGDAARSRTERGEAAGSQHQVSPGRMFDAALRDDRLAAAAAAVLNTSTTHPPSSTASSSASSSTADPATQSRLIDDRADREPQLRPRSSSSRAIDAAPPYPISSHHLHPTSTAAAAAGTVVTVPLPTLVEQQKARIHDLIYERDGLAEELQELRDLFHRLSEDYEQAAQESEARQLTLERVQVQHAVGQGELTQARATGEQLRQRIRDFEGEWETRTKHLRDQLDVLSEERDAAQEQRDGCMSELSRLRQQLQQLQAKLFNAEGEHREALRVQTESHAQEMRLALQEKAEQLQTRAAATRLEALLTQQQLTQIGAKQTAAEEDRAALQWRIAELETVVERREHLRGELERMVTSLRAQVADHERQSRSDAQRYTQRVHELEQTYEAQVHQEQHRCLTLKDELTAARRALQEVHRQHESQAEAHAAHARETAARAARQEDELREQLRQARASLAAATALATQHEAVALRCQREVEALRSAAAHHQERHAQLEETQTAQAQQLRRAEGRAEILQTRLQEKEREAEVLRCTMEQTAWTREAREAMQHSLAALCGVPRAAAVRWLQGTAADAPRLEWPPAAVSSSSSPKEPNSSPTAAPPAASPASPPAATSSVGQEQQRVEIKVENATPSATAAEGDDVRSPVRDAAASSQVAAAQHIESIERTVARDSTRPSGAATPAERLRTYAAPPLHPGSPRAPGTTSSAALLPLRTHPFAFAQTSTLASPQGTPSPARHQYNVAEGESAEQDSHLQPAEEPAPAVESDEKFFDDFHTPMGRRDGLRPPLWSAPRAGSHERQVPRPVAPQGTVRSPAKEMGGGGLQAAELLAQLPLRAPAASPSATPLATPFSSSSASAHAARRPRRTDHLSDDTNGLQQYLRETVQQVLATQQQHQQQQGSRSGGPPPPLQHRASPPVTRASAAAVQRQGLPGHSHYTQLFDGSPLRSAAGSRAVTEDEAAEEDFGSVSRPRSVLSVLPWQQRTPISTSAAVVPAGGESAPRVALRTPTPATTSSTHSRHHASFKTHSVTRVRIDAGVAETLEQLARRQQRLLESLAKESEAAPAKMGEVVNAGAPSDDVTRARAGPVPPAAWASPPPPPTVSVHGQTLSALPPEVSETTGSDAGIDPRQLSYATAATTTTAVTASSVQAERWWQPRGLAAAPRPLDTASTDRQGMTPSAMVATAATPPAAPALPVESATSASSNNAGGGDRALQGSMAAQSWTSADASAGVTRGAEQPTSERAEEDGGLFTAATTTSALTSVSDASSLTQLERRFAQPFHRQ